MCKLQTEGSSEERLPAYKRLANRIRDDIAQGRLQSGETLPSIRELSRLENTSPSNVRRAYDYLRDIGWIETSRGQHVRVAPAVENLVRAVTKSGPGTESGGSTRAPLAVACRQVIDFASREVLCPESAQARIEAVVRRAIADPNARQLSDPAGLPQLREMIAAHLKNNRGISCSADQILVAAWEQLLFMISHLFASPGQAIALENPGDPQVLSAFERRGAKPIFHDIDESGIIFSAQKLGSPPLLYLQAAAHFPTGAVLSRARRETIATWLNSVRTIIVEDDRSSEFVYDSRITPALRSLADEDKCIYLGAFSPVIPHQWRLSFAVVPQSIKTPLLRLKSMIDRCSSPIMQQAVCMLLEDGTYSRETRKLERELQNRRHVLVDLLKRRGSQLIRFTPVKGGFIQTIWLGDGIDDAKVAQECRRSGVKTTAVSSCAGSNHLVSGAPRNGLCLNFANASVEDIEYGITTILQAIAAQR